MLWGISMNAWEKVIVVIVSGMAVFVTILADRWIGINWDKLPTWKRFVHLVVCFFLGAGLLRLMQFLS